MYSKFKGDMSMTLNFCASIGQKTAYITKMQMFEREDFFFNSPGDILDDNL